MWHTPRFPGLILLSPRDRGPTGSRRSSHRRRSAVFRLERLEDRTVLSPLIVTSDADNGPGSLRDTIASAPSGSIIKFAENVHEITLTTGELVIDKSLDIEGLGPNGLTISGNDTYRVFDITNSNAEVTIAGLTITHGLAADSNLPLSDFPSTGGGVLNQGSLTLSNDVLSNNQARGTAGVPSGSGFSGGGNGGGVANLGTLTAMACLFIDNQALGADDSAGFVAGSGIGGGIANPPLASAVSHDASVIDCRFAGNVAQGGKSGSGTFAGAGLGGAISNASNLSVAGSIFTTNQAIGGDANGGGPFTGVGIGGAIVSGSPTGTSETLKVSGSFFVSNEAVGGNGPNPGDGSIGGGGGAIGVIKGSGTISGSTFDYNQALGGQGAADSAGGPGVGGGIYVNSLLSTLFMSPPVSVTASGCTVDHNTARGGPGGFDHNGGDGWGGGFANTSGATLTVRGTTVDYNQAIGGDGDASGNGGNGYGGGLYNDISSTLKLTGATVEYNQALRGSGGASGSDGQGVGGGVYNLGVFDRDGGIIKKNHASTSNDDIGP